MREGNGLSEVEESATKRRLLTIPIFPTLNFRCDRIGKGEVIFTFPHDKKFNGIFESFRDGLMMALADSAAVAVLSLAGADAITTTTDMELEHPLPRALPDRPYRRR